jgi:hypothetical protein
MTTDHQPRRVSLRALAAELNTHHSTLGTAVRDGRLRRGVSLDKRGRVVVTDADAAARNWRAIHTPQVLELERLESREGRAKPGPARVDDDARDVAETILNGAMVAAAIEGADDRKAAARAYVGRVLAHLRTEAKAWHADEEAIAIAEATLRETVDDIVDNTHPFSKSTVHRTSASMKS